MTPTQVHKFGGTSVLNADRVLNAARILADARSEGSTAIVGVTSALGGITDELIRACETARTGDTNAATAAAAAMQHRHAEAFDQIAAAGAVPPNEAAETRTAIDQLFGDLRELLHGTALLRELTPRTRDRVLATGEKAAARLLALALRGLGVPALALDADDFLRTTDDFGEADPLSYTDCPGVANAITPLLTEGVTPIVTGFCGRASDGATTTFGRGGSDFTATIIGAALRASEVTIWTDVPGVFSADPRVVRTACVLSALHFREASEMSYYGAKVLHPRTVIPIAGLGIPVRIRSSLEPALAGTLVSRDAAVAGETVKAVTAVRRQAIIAVEGNGMAGVPGIAGRVFSTLASMRISVTMISQASSESSVCFAVPEADAAAADAALRAEFGPEIEDGTIEAVRVRTGVGLVAVVGLGMAHTPGVAARVFTAVAESRINVLAIAQGSSELNITLGVDDGEIDRALVAIHDACIAGLAPASASPPR